MLLPKAPLQFFRRRERQSTLTFEELAQAAVAGAARAAHHRRRDAVAEFAAPASAFEPVFPAHDLSHGDRGGFGFRVHSPLRSQAPYTPARYRIPAYSQASGLLPNQPPGRRRGRLRPASSRTRARTAAPGDTPTPTHAPRATPPLGRLE